MNNSLQIYNRDVLQLTHQMVKIVTIHEYHINKGAFLWDNPRLDSQIQKMDFAFLY